MILTPCEWANVRIYSNWLKQKGNNCFEIMGKSLIKRQHREWFELLLSNFFYQLICSRIQKMDLKNESSREVKRFSDTWSFAPFSLLKIFSSSSSFFSPCTFIHFVPRCRSISSIIKIWIPKKGPICHCERIKWKWF